MVRVICQMWQDRLRSSRWPGHCSVRKCQNRLMERLSSNVDKIL